MPATGLSAAIAGMAAPAKIEINERYNAVFIEADIFILCSLGQYLLSQYWALYDTRSLMVFERGKSDMPISMIVAMAENRVIGKNNPLPWHLPADLKHFKSITMSKPIVMGRKTYESIGRPLPGRTNIILTRNLNFNVPECEVFSSPEKLLATYAAEEIIIIGGANIYSLFLPQANRLYLTRVHTHVDGDTFFPPIDEKEWHEVSREDFAPDGKNNYSYSFVVLER